MNLIFFPPKLAQTKKNAPKHKNSFSSSFYMVKHNTYFSGPSPQEMLGGGGKKTTCPFPTPLAECLVARLGVIQMF